MKEKIIGFVKENWCGVVIAGATVAADIAICAIYKRHLDKQ